MAAATWAGVDMSGDPWYLFGYVATCPSDGWVLTHHVSRHFDTTHVGLMILCVCCGYRRVEWHKLR